MKNTFVLWKNHINRDVVKGNAQAFMDRLPVDKSFDVIIQPHVEARSDSQRNALFGVAEKSVAEFCGLHGSRDMEELHRNLCGEYFGWVEAPALGRKPVRTTTRNERDERDEISVGDALDMYTWIQQWAAEKLGCYVPDPDPMWREKAAAA